MEVSGGQVFALSLQEIVSRSREPRRTKIYGSQLACRGSEIKWESIPRPRDSGRKALLIVIHKVSGKQSAWLIDCSHFVGICRQPAPWRVQREWHATCAGKCTRKGFLKERWKKKKGKLRNKLKSIIIGWTSSVKQVRGSDGWGNKSRKTQLYVIERKGVNEEYRWTKLNK